MSQQGSEEQGQMLYTDLQPAPQFSTAAFDAFERARDGRIVYQAKASVAPLEGNRRAERYTDG